MFNIGPLELVVVLLIALVVVGPKRLPEIGRQVGRALHDLRKVQTEVKDAIRFDLDGEAEPPTRRASWSPPEAEDTDDQADERARSEAAAKRAERRAAERARMTAERSSGSVPAADAPEEADAPAASGDGPEATHERAGSSSAPPEVEVPDASGATPSPNGSTPASGEPD